MSEGLQPRPPPARTHRTHNHTYPPTHPRTRAPGLQGFSKKDRIAKQMIETAEAEGQLSPGQTVVELTSGNTGTGLAIVCGIRGYKFVAVMSEGNSPERARMMRALGAEVVLVPQGAASVKGQVTGDDLALVEEEARRVVEARGAFRADQFELLSNADAHYRGTGPEVWSQSGGRLDAFVDLVGSGGTLAGAARFFKELAPGVRCFCVEPTEAAVIAAARHGAPQGSGQHRIQGGGYSMAALTQLQAPDGSAHALIDGYLQVTDDEATGMARRLASEEGIFGGFSAGANVAAAVQVLRSEWGQQPGGKVVCAVICDSGLKYLSTDLWPA